VTQKAWDDRITETIQFIRGWTGGANAPYAPQVAAHLESQTYTNPGMQGFSAAMAQGDYVAGSTAFKDRRKARRAITLIRCALLGKPVATVHAAVKLIHDGMLDSQLNYEIGLVRGNAQQALNAAWAQLCNNTAAFVQNNTLIVRSNASQGVQNFYFSHQDDQNRYAIEPPGMPTRFLSILVQINHIPVTRYAAVQHTLNQITGVDLDQNHPTFTTQLTGCSYMFQINGAAAKAAHIWPAGAITPTNLTAALRNAPADFQNGNGGVATVFGAEGANTVTGYVHGGTWTYIVAVYAGAWEIHAQQVPQGQNAPRTYTRIV
jgi:hypothetical protein